jgi:ComF family protein
MAAASYEAQAKELLYALKFERKRAAAEPMATLLARQMTTLSSAYLVVHLPTANARVRLRGYDQAQQIARGVARNLGLPYAALLSRQGARRQVGQDRATRQSQMHDALYVANPRAVAGRSILLIDDVITTGASIVAAASVLRAAGARRVTAAAFAIA